MINQNFNGISSNAVTSQMSTDEIIQPLLASLKSDAQRIQQLVQQGNVTQEQGQYLMQQIVNKENLLHMYMQPLSLSPDTQSVQEQFAQIDLFNQENPEFFGNNRRADLLNYLKGLDVDKDEIAKIAKLAENLENSAVENYLKQSAHTKSLNDENTVAKSKLTSYAQQAPADSKYARIFTREDIGKMSGDEFIKNEKLIMEQAKQGLIK